MKWTDGNSGVINTCYGGSGEGYASITLYNGGWMGGSPTETSILNDCMEFIELHLVKDDDDDNGDDDDDDDSPSKSKQPGGGDRDGAIKQLKKCGSLEISDFFHSSDPNDTLFRVNCEHEKKLLKKDDAI